MGDRCNDLSPNSSEKLRFRVRKDLRNIFKRDLSYQVIINIGCSDSIGQASSCYRIEGLAGKSAFKITQNGKLAAEVSLILLFLKFDLS